MPQTRLANPHHNVQNRQRDAQDNWDRVAADPANRRSPLGRLDRPPQRRCPSGSFAIVTARVGRGDDSHPSQSTGVVTLSIRPFEGRVLHSAPPIRLGRSRYGRAPPTDVDAERCNCECGGLDVDARKVSRGRACFDYLTEHLRGGAANLRNDYKVLRRKRAQFVLHDPCERVVVRMPGDIRSHGGGQPFPAGAPARSALLIAASTAWCPSRLTAISRVVVAP